MYVVGDPNKKDVLRGCTAVHYAGSEDHPECLDLLIKAGGRYDVLNTDKKTPLHVATGDCLQILQTLSTYVSGGGGEFPKKPK